MSNFSRQKKKKKRGSDFTILGLHINEYNAVKQDNAKDNGNFLTFYFKNDLKEGDIVTREPSLLRTSDVFCWLANRVIYVLSGIY